MTLKMMHNKKKNIAPIEQENARMKKGVKKCSRIPAINEVSAATGTEIKHILRSGLKMFRCAFVAFLIFLILRSAVSVMLSPNE